jgi:selenocysteine-specific elongation factor
MCIAADDGVMPQTHEHMAVLRQLGVARGVVAVTKADAADPAAAIEEAAELAPGAEVVAVSALSGDGLDELRAALDRAVAATPSRGLAEGAAVRLHIDRSFTLKGIGTVVTGTLWAGTVAAGDQIEILPAGLRARVRSVQVHDEQVERAAAGQRVALNLVGVSRRDVSRGDVVVAGGSLKAAYIVDAALDLEAGVPPIEAGTRIHVHHGTRESPGRVYPLGDGRAQLRLESPIVAERGDRLILRRLAPPDTIGGGVVVDPAALRHGPGKSSNEEAPVLADAPDPADASRPADASGEAGARREAGASSEAAARHDSDPPPLDAVALAIADLLRLDGERPRTDSELASAAGGGSDGSAAFAALERAGLAVQVTRNLHFDPAVLEALTRRVVAICERDGFATIAGLRDALGTSRKYAQALLEHLDSSKVTIRRGDEHVLRGSARRDQH